MKKNKGFTLIELLAVIVILGILLSISIVAVNNIRKKQDEKNYYNVLSSIFTGAKNYCSDHDCNTSVEVSKLLENEYVDFDTTRYNDLYSKNVTIVSCGDDQGLKCQYRIDFDNKDNYNKSSYNDCGCAEQEAGNSSIICGE